MNTAEQGSKKDFLVGGGDMGELIRNIDWSETPIGPVELWPQSLRTSVSIMLNTHFPMYIAWGDEFIQFYNDGYRPILGSTKHPAAMGISSKITFAEIWNIIGPMFEGVMEGKAVGFTDFMLPLDRHGFIEECYFIFSYSPIKQENGLTGGVLVTVTETSERLLGERRLKTLRYVGDRCSQSKNIPDAAESILDAIASNKHDIPFALLYTYDALKDEYKCAGGTGIELEQSAIPEAVKVKKAAVTNPLIALPLGDFFESISFSKDLPWPELPKSCCCITLTRPDQKNAFGLLLLGISARLRYDHQYQNFYKLLKDQAVTALSNANAFEEERKRAEALAAIDKAKTDFFSNISHEFRTPLTLMLGPLEELLQSNGKLNGRERENADAAHRNAIRLLRLVNTLLDFSRIESGRIEAAFRLVDICSFTTDISSNFRSIIEKAGLTFTIKCGTIDEKVYVDLGMWEKIVLNLLSNAFKYTLSGSIAVTLSQEAKNIILKVKDTGVGIPENELPHMFKRFHRVAHSAGRSYEGTGIGLSLVSELVRLHKGTITVESKVNVGSTFIVSLPVGSAHLPSENVYNESGIANTSILAEAFLKEATVHASQEVYQDVIPDGESYKEKPGQKEGTILIVDDNADMVNYLKRVMEQRYTIWTAPNGKAALDTISHSIPDLVISDIMMPVMDGVEMLKRIKADDRTANLPVMLLSARAGEESRIEGYDLGADDYLVKPFSAKELLARAKSQIQIAQTRSHLSALLKQVFEQTPAAIAIIRKEDYRVDFANELYLQLVDKGREFIGKSLFASLPELKIQGIPELLDKVMNSGIAHLGNELEVSINRRGRREKTFFNFVYHPFREEDQSISGVIVVCFEVTELVNARKRAEESEIFLEAKVAERTMELLESAKTLEEKNQLLLKVNQELEQFAYVASHDLQEPLRKIRTFSSILERNFASTAESKTYFQKIHSSSERMSRLIKDVLNYSRLSNTDGSVATVNLQEVLDTVVSDFELMIQEKNAKVIYGKLPSVKGIQLQLHQLFANLVSNSLKFSKGDPVVELSHTIIPHSDLNKYEFLPAVDTSYVEISCRDNGIGFDPKFTDRIFTIFQRLHEKETSGTGIGLALCKKIVENHRGHIAVDSKPNEGSTFIVYLPM